VAQTNYRNELEWGYAFDANGGKPANAHTNHIKWINPIWSLDQDGWLYDSRIQCVTCHNPHGVQAMGGGSTLGRTRADLNLTFDVYNDGTTDYQYGYIGSSEYWSPGGDLFCWPCHQWHGPGLDPPDHLDYNHPQTRYYRVPLDLPKRTCVMCHAASPDEKIRTEDAAIIATDATPRSSKTACSTPPDGFTDADCLVCHDMSRHRLGEALLTAPKADSKHPTRVGFRGSR
jgi:hypothetical protein